MDDNAATVLLIQFARTPVAGRVKTRMLPHLTAAQACDLHCELTLWTCRQLLNCRLGEVELSVAGDTTHPLFTRCRALGVVRVSQQRGADLGQRMYRALHDGLAEFDRVVLVGSDCPEIDAGYLGQAVAALGTAPLVLGPASDGGYVLIGARKITQEVFRDIPWGSDQVYAQTASALTQAGLPWAQLPILTDIDRPDDLPVWDALQRAAHTRARSV